MKITIAAACLAALGALSPASSTATAQSSEQQTQAKKCRYGSYITSTGKRRCRRRPRGSSSGGSFSG